MKIPYLPNLYDKIKDVFNTHNNIIIALDFDDTIFDWKSKGYDVDYVIDLVKRAQKVLHAKVILFTCREGLVLAEAVDYCKDNGISLFGINRNPDLPPTNSKPFYNILMDDKACLPEVCGIIECLIQAVQNENDADI